MLWKLSLTGIKGRLRDYIVLFSGLVIASGIFYMFESMATNEAFLKNNSLISSVVIIFHFGSILLGIITLVYILYANSFLMNMRQKDYAMFMMLGAKSRKIAQLVFIETFFVGIVATVIGTLLGLGLATGVNHLLLDQLHLAISYYSPVSTQAFLVTFVFFALLFLVAAVINARDITKKPLLTLMKGSATPVQSNRNPVLLLIETLVGVGLLALGYYLMANLLTFQIFGIFGALVTIALGTYLIFHSLIILLLRLLKRSDRVVFHGLNNFTLSQLSFRIQDYTKMLAMVAMLFALALGALTVGLGFKNEIPKLAKASTAYDLVLNNAQLVSEQQVQKLAPTLSVSYTQKEDDQTMYYIKEQFDEDKLIAPSIDSFATNSGYRYFSGSELAGDVAVQDSLRELELPAQREKDIQFVSQEEFDSFPLPEASLRVIQVADFEDKLAELTKLTKTNVENNPSLTNPTSYGQRVTMYGMYNTLFSGFEFMGFFLGIAFLTMLASCLMFKILSGANSDIQRYGMLEKIGTRQVLLKGAIRKEVALLFVAPGVLGAIHVLFGLKMFTGLLLNPYEQIWLPFLIFVLIYAGYYLLTVWLYTSIVLNKD